MERQTVIELFRLRLAPHSRLETTPDGEWSITTPTIQVPLGKLSPKLAESVQTLAAAGATEQALAGQVLTGEGLGMLTLFQYQLERCRQLGLLAYHLDWRGTSLASCIPLSMTFRLDQSAPITEPMVLSRFCYCHAEAGGLAVESPLGLAKVLLHDPQAALLIGRLATPCDRAGLAALLPDLDPARLDALLIMLFSSGALLACDADGATPEDSNTALRQWDFHDLLFHARSRIGRHYNPAGRNFRFRGSIEPLPALKPVPADRPLIPLPQPDLNALMRTDPPLAAVLEQRRSLRTQATQPPTLAQLGAFLYRSARVRSLSEVPFHEVEGEDQGTMELTSRPYPGGGAIYELELYLSIHRCDGLAPGFYHYEPHDHALTLVRPHDQLVEQLLHYASNAASLSHTPDILITLAARFQRMSWKYQSIAYATILKDVGVLYQTMYLVATALGLSPCAVGSGNSDLFVAAAGTDYYTEGSVGEFVLGGPVDASAPDHP
ncbi:MAG: SagB family peptide dehydrogenase [Roseiflexaceae bacterium]